MTKKESQVLIEFIETAIYLEKKGKLYQGFEGERITGYFEMFNQEQTLFVTSRAENKHLTNPHNLLKFVKENFRQIRKVSRLSFTVLVGNSFDYYTYSAFKGIPTIRNLKNKM
jgi:hypothetical protein